MDEDYKFVVNVDLNQNELRNAVIQNLASAPLFPVKGQIYFDSIKLRLFVWNGVEWEPLSGNQAKP